MTSFRFQMRRMARAAMPVVVLVAVSALVVACGSSKPPRTAPPTGTAPSQSTTTQPTEPAQPTQPPTEATPTSPAGTPWCATSDLKVWMDRALGGGTAGTYYYLIEFKNISDRACSLHGFPGVSAYANGRQLGSAATWDRSTDISTVTLRPAEIAHSVLPITDVGALDRATCAPMTATSVKVYPPNQSTPAWVSYRFEACSLPGLSYMRVWPVQAGSGGPESVQPMKQLVVPFGSDQWRANVVLTVPRTWLLSKTQPAAIGETPPTICVVKAGTDYANRYANCLLTVTYEAGTYPFSPNAPAAGDSSNPVCHNWSTSQESNWTLDGRQGEYRRFVNHCTGAQFEQWTVMTSPQIAFWHQITPQSGHTLVSGIVNSAVLPPQTGTQRPYDVGYVRQVTQRSGGYYLRVDRVVPNLDGTVTNLNPATYEYRLGRYVWGAPLPASCDWSTNRTCALAWLLRQFAKGRHPADGSFVVDGAYVEISRHHNGFDLMFSATFRYQR